MSPPIAIPLPTATRETRPYPRPVRRGFFVRSEPMLRIATWNINSVRLRIDQVARFVAEAGVDVLCLQEIKCLEDQFPRAAFVNTLFRR